VERVDGKGSLGASVRGLPMSLTAADLANREDRVHILLGRLVHTLARLDFSIGLQLRSLGQHRGVDVRDLLDPKQPFQQRFRRLKPLVLDIYGHENQEIRQQFEDWFARALNAKALRNDYAHGRWDFGSAFHWDGDTVNFIPLSWETDPAAQPAPIVVSLKAFHADVETAEGLLRDYWKLEKRYRGLAS
jgi:hypothetical protein